MKSIFLIAAFLLTGVLCWTAPTTTQPLGSVLTIERLIQGVSGGQPSVPYHVDSFDLSGTGKPDIGLEGTLWANLTQTTAVTQYVVNSWSSSLWPVPFTTDDPESPVYPRKFLSPYEADLFVMSNKIEGVYYSVPTYSRRVDVDNPFLEYFNMPGTCGKIQGYTVCRFPMSYVEEAQNCVYSGATLVAFDENRVALGAYFSTIVSHCAYYDTISFGFVDVNWDQHSLTEKNSARYQFNKWRNGWMPVKSIVDLPENVWHTMQKSGSPPTIDLENNVWNNPSTRSDYFSAWDYAFRMKNYGVYFDHAYYTGPTETHIGRLPFSMETQIAWPSYSTDKGAWLGLLVGALDYYFGASLPESLDDTEGTTKILDITVTNYIPDAPAHWSTITLRMLLDMRSQHYDSTAFNWPAADETTVDNNVNFFYEKTMAKLDYALNSKSNVPPSSQDGFVYMTSTYFVAAVMLENLVQQQLEMNLEEAHRMLVCEPLQFSETYCSTTMHTYDEREQVYGGYGSFITLQDTARLLEFYVDSDEGKLGGNRIVSREFFRRQLPIDPNYRGAFTNTFYGRNVTNTTIFREEYFSMGMWSSYKLESCSPDYPILPYLSGFSGTRYPIARSDTNGWAMVQRQDNFDFRDRDASCYLVDLISPTNYAAPAA
jgi:CubicO group peptidase (beta-lactamase class C family)